MEQITRKSIEKEYTIESGIIRDSGKMEGNPIYIPYYYDMMMNGMD